MTPTSKQDVQVFFALLAFAVLFFLFWATFYDGEEDDD